MIFVINEQYVVDKRGEPVSVILDIGVYRKILEELAAVRAYDAAKASGDEAILFEQAIEEIERMHQRLSTMPSSMLTVVGEESLRRQRERDADELLSLCDAAAEMWRGDFDAVEEIRQMRQERDEQIWPSRL